MSNINGRVEKLERATEPPGRVEIRVTIADLPGDETVRIVWVQDDGREKPITRPLPAGWYEAL